MIELRSECIDNKIVVVLGKYTGKIVKWNFGGKFLQIEIFTAIMQGNGDTGTHFFIILSMSSANSLCRSYTSGGMGLRICAITSLMILLSFISVGCTGFIFVPMLFVLNYKDKTIIMGSQAEFIQKILKGAENAEKRKAPGGLF
jgi:hypothetical protein